MVEITSLCLVGNLIALLSIWNQRETRRVDLAKTRAELEAKCRLLGECKVKIWTNAIILTEAILNQIFSV